MTEAYFDSNRELWDAWTRLHIQGDSYYRERIAQVQAGGSVLDPLSCQEVGAVDGKTLLHLQCHFGLETISWARAGASVTGVDFSPESIDYARALSRACGVNAEFVCANVYDVPERLDRTYDIVYTAEGVLHWLPDLPRWAAIVSAMLKPGGVFYLYEHHPFRRVMFPVRVDDDGTPVQHNYFSGAMERVVERGSYALPTPEIRNTAHYWVHGLGEVVSALCAAGLIIEFLHEFPKVYDTFPAYLPEEPGTFQMHLLRQWAVPNMYSLRARKPA